MPQIVADAVKALVALNPQALTDSGSIFRNPLGSLITASELGISMTKTFQRLAGGSVPIATHQFRKFFAQFYLRRYQGNVDAISRHFRHVSRDMVWAYAGDALNAAYLAESKAALAQEIAKAVVFEEGYQSGHVVGALRDVRTSGRLRAKILTPEDAAAYIDRQIREAFIDVHAMEWGYCLFQKGDKGAACEARSGPIEERSEPATCGRCKFLCTGSENLPFWQQAALLHQGIVAHPQATCLMRNESERFLTTAAQILKRHEGGSP